MKIKKMDLEANIIFYPIGWVYLWVRYRNKETIEKVLVAKYEESYSVAGKLVCLKTFGVVFITLILLMILVVFYSMIKHGIS